MSKNEDDYYFELIKDTYPEDTKRGAVIVSDGTTTIMLPKSMITVTKLKNRDVSITIPNWLAIDREII